MTKRIGFARKHLRNVKGIELAMKHPTRDIPPAVAGVAFLLDYFPDLPVSTEDLALHAKEILKILTGGPVEVDTPFYQFMTLHRFHCLVAGWAVHRANKDTLGVNTLNAKEQFHHYIYGRDLILGRGALADVDIDGDLNDLQGCALAWALNSPDTEEYVDKFDAKALQVELLGLCKYTVVKGVCSKKLSLRKVKPRTPIITNH